MADVIQGFLAKMGTDHALQEEVKHLVAGTTPSSLDETANALSALAREHGFEIPAADIAARLSFESRELQEDELEAVAGGMVKAEAYAAGTDPRKKQVLTFHYTLGTGL